MLWVIFLYSDIGWENSKFIDNWSFVLENDQVAEILKKTTTANLMCARCRLYRQKPSFSLQCKVQLEGDDLNFVQKVEDSNQNNLEKGEEELHAVTEMKEWFPKWLINVNPEIFLFFPWRENARRYWFYQNVWGEQPNKKTGKIACRNLWFQTFIHFSHKGNSLKS